MARLLSGINVALLGLWLACTVVHADVNVICLMQHCADESFKCGTDATCATAVTCMSGCGTDQKCVMKCVDSYGNDVFSRFTSCAISKHKCITLEKADPAFTCSKPEKTVKSFNMSKLEGNWYKLGGTNPVYDCYDCQHHHYGKTEISDGLKSSSLKIDYLVNSLAGDVLHKVCQRTVTQPDPKQPGVLVHSYESGGLALSDEYRILHVDEKGSFALMYYCGNTTVYGYEGLNLFSREPTLSEFSMNMAKQVMELYGFDSANFCNARTTGCPF